MNGVHTRSQTSILDNVFRANLINGEWNHPGIKVAPSPLPEGGVGCFATKSYATGDLLFKANSFASAVDNPLVGYVCDYCLKYDYSNHKIDRCAGCHFVYYCSRQCQIAAWEDLHKYECPLYKVFKSTSQEPIPRTASLFVRLLIRTKLQRDNLCTPESKSIFGSYLIFEQLLSHINKMNGDQRFRYTMLSSITASILTKQPMKNVTNDQTINVLDYLSKGLTNGFHVDDDQVLKAAVIYPYLSLLNHSCRPNAIQLFTDNSCQLRALRPIEQGEEILIHYHMQGQEHNQLRQQLKENSYFNCQCVVCQDFVNNHRLGKFYKCNACPDGRVEVQETKGGTTKVYCMSCNKKISGGEYKKFKLMEKKAERLDLELDDVPRGAKLVEKLKEMMPALEYLHCGHPVYYDLQITLLRGNPSDNMAFFCQYPFLVPVLALSRQHFLYHLGPDQPPTLVTDLCAIGQKEKGEEMIAEARTNLESFDYFPPQTQRT
ncbi:hypothetical protein SAMD00019534_025440 [Acytostelium subglobosum LB1]|uniref:hypothetical protein n=1 Tax=Acytostelium subglobosum LB1 TaxID=1410327 RepID=UPI000644939E|nr:hypothetical protein SAMD00019534_025440 [Acytostelium subglobosum LB1]GAM19369.1 hypothetical protein SAMD00019534_025440 [Acytostelium subglobosum LB1]|eukprot:XP_012757296.1 hypothetical protein SAMD00019534_025440 [Acytostelium subglobosum LB1]